MDEATPNNTAESAVNSPEGGERQPAKKPEPIIRPVRGEQKPRTQEEFFEDEEAGADEGSRQAQERDARNTDPKKKEEPKPKTEVKPENTDPPPPAKRKFTINGKEGEYTQEEIDRAASKSLAADERFRRADEIEKRINRRLADLEKRAADSPILAAALRGEDAVAVAEQLWLDQFNKDQQRRQMSPAEQKMADELEEERQKRLQYERENQELRIPQMREAQNRANLQAGKEIEETILGALKANGIEKPDPYLIHEMAIHMLSHLHTEDRRMDEGQALKRTLAHREKLLASKMEALTTEEALKILPKQVLDGIRDHFRGQALNPLKKPDMREGNVSQGRKKRSLTMQDIFG